MTALVIAMILAGTALLAMAMIAFVDGNGAKAVAALLLGVLIGGGGIYIVAQDMDKKAKQCQDAGGVYFGRDDRCVKGEEIKI